jgi:replicative DNA helicase
VNDRTPPQDLDAERAALGGMLLSITAVEDVMAAAGREDFYLPKHLNVFDAVAALYARGEPADSVTVARELSARGELARVGGPGYLHELTESVPMSANAGYYAEIVHEKAVLRRIVEAGMRITQMGYETDGADLEEIVSRMQEEAYSITARREESSESSQADSAERFVAGLVKPTERGLTTGFADLDELTGGFRPGQLIIIGARSGCGKTTLCLDMLRHMSISRGIPSALFSLEMLQDELTARAFSAEGRIPLHHLRHESMTEDDWARIDKHYKDISEAPIYVDDSPGLNLMSVISGTRTLVRRQQVKVAAVDYFQMLTAGNGRRYESREREAAAVIYGLKNLAKALRITVIALAQLNRGPSNRSDPTPRMSDIRETGVAEQACDVGILIHRPDMYERESPRAGEADLIVDKHRGGPRATVTVAFQGHYSRFVDMREEPPRRPERPWSPHDAADR